MQVAWPLHELTSSENAGKKKAAIKWDSRCQQAFDDLTTASIHTYADFTKPFKLHTDTCGTGLGAVLYQTWEDGTEAVIVCASRKVQHCLSKAESHYPAHKLEFPTLKRALVEKFPEYLHGYNMCFSRVVPFILFAWVRW